MKKYLVFALAAVAFVGCSKTPDIAAINQTEGLSVISEQIFNKNDVITKKGAKQIKQSIEKMDKKSTIVIYSDTDSKVEKRRSATNRINAVKEELVKNGFKRRNIHTYVDNGSSLDEKDLEVIYPQYDKVIKIVECDLYEFKSFCQSIINKKKK